MTAGAKADQLGRVVDIRIALVIRLLKRGNINENLSRRRLAGQWMNRHLLSTPLFLTFVSAL